MRRKPSFNRVPRTSPERSPIELGVSSAPDPEGNLPFPDSHSTECVSRAPLRQVTHTPHQGRARGVLARGGMSPGPSRSCPKPRRSPRVGETGCGEHRSGQSAARQHVYTAGTSTVSVCWFYRPSCSPKFQQHPTRSLSSSVPRSALVGK